MTWILVSVITFSLAVAVIGIVGIIRDGRRISTVVYAILGFAAAVFSLGFLLFERGHPALLLGVGITALIVLVLGNILGYPLLVVFLLWSGLTVLRRESRTLGNALALLAGISLIALTATLRLLEPQGTVQDDPAYMIRYGVHFAVALVVAYVGFAFAAFIIASLLYRWRPSRATPEAIVVLGAGLIGGQVPPLLAGRLKRGLQVQQMFGGTPLIITSGGQGPDEPVAEGTAMRNYLIEQGAPPERVAAETQSRNTVENLRFSAELLSGPSSPMVVVTSSYHAFRAALLTRSLGMRAHVVGARTAWYFLPSALLREFIAVVRDRPRLHIVCVLLLVAFAALFTIILVPAMVPPEYAPG
ncbi:YdcF family protein [Nesterenkonia muleiensis]|uniref:YdcF family protein n=1 Tax=Nesterenkonia muleiensis TaxID=2282648 RepID=UPI00192E3230|nr:YdcF family protein [Nesterenkonia muleiensis]